MLRLDKTKLSKKEFYGAKKLIKILDGDADSIAISKLIETMNNSK